MSEPAKGSERDWYKWSGIDMRTGRLRRGKVEAENYATATAAAEDSGVVPVSVKQMGSLMVLMTSDSLGKAKASPEERAGFYRSLALAAATEKPLVYALDSALTGMKKRSRMRQAVVRMKRVLAAGGKPEEALRSEAKILGNEAAAVYEASAQTGTPEVALEELAAITEQAGEIASKVRVAMAQPVLYLVMALVAAVAMLLFVMPALEDTFTEFGGELPTPTKIVLGMSDLLVENVATIGALCVLSGIGAAALWQRDDVRLYASEAALRSPLLGPILSAMSTQRMCALIGVMLSADVPHETTLRITAESMRAPAVRRNLLNAADDLRDKTLEAAVRDRLAHIDPALEALASQSMSGMADPGSNWSRYGQFKRRETDRKVTGLADTLQPLMIVVVGGLVGGMLLAFYLPMFSVFEVVSEGSGL